MATAIPRKAVNRLTVVPEPDWKAELQRRVRSELIAFDIEHRHSEQSFAWETFVSAILDAQPVLPGLESQQSDSLTWVTHILRDSKILDAPITWPDKIVTISSAAFGHSLPFRWTKQKTIV